MNRHSLEARQRPLTDSEIRFLRMRSLSLQRRGRGAISAGLWIGLVVIVTLWAATLLASDAPVLIVTGFWLVVGALIIFWVRRDLTSDSRTMDAVAIGLESAVRRNLADVYDITSSGFVEFEEVEDEGACYAFQIDDDRLVFLQGQEFYAEGRFPSLDFSLICPLDQAGRHIHMFVEKRGPKAKPQRIVPASVKRKLQFPADLEIVKGALDGIEGLLSRH